MTDIKFNCPHCGQSLEAPEDMRGLSIECPSCNKSFISPPPHTIQAHKQGGCRRVFIILSVAINIIGIIILLGGVILVAPAVKGFEEIGKAGGIEQLFIKSGRLTRVNAIVFRDALLTSGINIENTNVVFSVGDIEKILKSAAYGTDPYTRSVRVDVMDTKSNILLYSEIVHITKNDANEDIAHLCLTTNTFGVTLIIRKD